mgnify:CR=1 FL=1
MGVIHGQWDHHWRTQSPPCYRREERQYDGKHTNLIMPIQYFCMRRTHPEPHTRHTKSNENECYEVDNQLSHGPAKPTTMQQSHLSEERNLTIVARSRLYLHLMELSVRGCSIVKIGTREHHQRVTPCGNVAQQIIRIHLRKCHRLPALVGFELVKTHDTCSKDLSVFRLYHSSHLPIIST